MPDLILAALIWLLVLRLVLSLTFDAGHSNALLRLVGAVTSPVVTAVGVITPRVVATPFVIIFAVAWLLAARIALFFAISATGVRLSMG